MRIHIKRYFILCCSLFVCCVFSACSHDSVSEVERIDKEHPYVSDQTQNTEKPVQDKEKETEAYDHKVVTIDGNDKDSSVTIIGVGDHCSYNGFDFCVTNVWLEDDLSRLDEIEGNRDFHEFLVSQKNYGNPILEDSGKYQNGDFRWIIIKMSIQNNGGQKKINFSTPFYNGNEKDQFTNIYSAECQGYDAYPKLSDKKTPHKDGLFCILNKDEKVDTVVVYQVSSAKGILDDVYMSTKFLSKSSGTSNSEIPSGSYMIRLKIKDDVVTK